MRWNLLGDVADLIAAITVIASLIYMATQVRHAKQTFIFSSQQQVSMGLANMMADIWKDAEICQLWVRALTNSDELSEAEQDRMGPLLMSYFHHIANILELAEADQHFLDNNRAMIDRLLRAPRVQGW